MMKLCRVNISFVPDRTHFMQALIETKTGDENFDNLLTLEKEKLVDWIETGVYANDKDIRTALCKCLLRRVNSNIPEITFPKSGE